MLGLQYKLWVSNAIQKVTLFQLRHCGRPWVSACTGKREVADRTR